MWLQIKLSILFTYTGLVSREWAPLAFLQYSIPWSGEATTIYIEPFWFSTIGIPTNLPSVPGRYFGDDRGDTEVSRLKTGTLVNQQLQS